MPSLKSLVASLRNMMEIDIVIARKGARVTRDLMERLQEGGTIALLAAAAGERRGERQHAEEVAAQDLTARIHHQTPAMTKLERATSQVAAR